MEIPSSATCAASISRSLVDTDEFINHGFVCVRGAFPRDIADACRALLWEATGCSPDDPSTWTQPVVRVPGMGQQPFVDAANTECLHEAFDALVGPGRWRRRDGIGTIPVRFPHPDDPGDAGWHIDASFPPSDGPGTLDYGRWRHNLWFDGTSPVERAIRLGLDDRC